MSAVKPPEWDAMSANEQLLWYLKRLCAKAEEMSLALGVASADDSRVVNPLLDPAASTMTHASSAPVPDVSGSTTTSQEVLEVIHDGPPMCIAMVPVTCSTECSTQVDTIDSVDKIHDAATTVHLEPVVDLNGKEVEQPFSTPATASSTTSSAMPRALASTTAVKCQEGLTAVHDTSTKSITVASMTCSMNCSNEGITALSLTTPIATGSLLSTVTLALVNAMQPFVNHNLDHNLDASLPQGLPLRPMPWPSLGRDLADGNEVRPIPWPSFAVKKFMEHPFQFVQLLDMLTSSTFPMESYHVGYLVGNHSGHCIRLISVELSYLWPLQQNNVSSGPCKHVKLFSSNKQWFLELCTCTIILALEVHYSCLASMAVHGVRSVKNHGAWNTASSFCLQLIQLEPVLPSDLASITEQRQLISDKYPWQHVVSGLRYELAYCSEANHFYWYLKILRMLVVQTVQVATKIQDSDFSLFAIGAFLFGQKQSFLWTPYSAKFLLFHRANSVSGYFSVCDRRRCCYLVLLDVFKVPRSELMLATGIQPRLSECQPGDWFHDVILSACNTYIPEPSLAKFQALKKRDCEHLISTGACNLFMDKGCLKCCMLHKESDLTMLQTSRTLCVQPRCYFEVGSNQAYLKLKVVDATIIYMFEHRNNWDWELLIHFKRPPDPASFWECITDRRFPLDQILLMIFHPWLPTHVTYLMGVCCCGSWPVTQETSCLGTLPTHAGRLIYMDFINMALLGSEVIQGKQIKYKGLLSYSLCVLQPREGTEYLVHGNISSEFYLRKFALVRKLDSSGLTSSVEELRYDTSVWLQEDCKCVTLIPLGNEEAPTSTVTQPVQSHFNGFASSCLIVSPVHGFNSTISSAPTVKWVVEFGAFLLSKLPHISLCLPSVQPEHPWPFPVAAMFTQQLLFPMSTITRSVPLLKIYARLYEVGITHLLGSKLTSTRHLEQSWDPGPGDKTLSVQICRIMFQDGQDVVIAMQFSSGCHKEHFQGGNSPSFVPSSHLLPSMILMVHIISKGAPAMSGTIVVAVFTQRLVGHEQYIGFYRDSDHVQEHRVHWDPGGLRWSAWGQAAFQEEGDVRSLLGPAPSTSTWARPGCAPRRAIRTTSTSTAGANELSSGSRHRTARRLLLLPPALSLSLFQFLVPLVMADL